MRWSANSAKNFSTCFPAFSLSQHSSRWKIWQSDSCRNTWQWRQLFVKAILTEPPLGKKKKKNQKHKVLFNTSHSHPALSSVPVKTQISHKNNQRVGWRGQDYFSSSLCNHSEALSQSETLSEYSASQQPSQKQQRLKLPSSLLALHLSSLSGKPSWGISAQRALAHSVSDASWPIRKISWSIAARGTSCPADCRFYSMHYKVRNILTELLVPVN